MTKKILIIFLILLIFLLALVYRENQKLKFKLDEKHPDSGQNAQYKDNNGIERFDLKYQEQDDLIVEPSDFKEAKKLICEQRNLPDRESLFFPDVIPVIGEYVISKNYSARHPAVDFATKCGTEIRASASGKVTSVFYDKIFGNVIFIDHLNGYFSIYAHLQTGLVPKNHFVEKKDVIALAGNTGYSTACHLHYEIIKNGSNLDPLSIISERNQE